MTKAIVLILWVTAMMAAGCTSSFNKAIYNMAWEDKYVSSVTHNN